MLHRNTKTMLSSNADNSAFFNIVEKVLQGKILAPYLTAICQENTL